VEFDSRATMASPAGAAELSNTAAKAANLEGRLIMGPSIGIPR